MTISEGMEVKGGSGVCNHFATAAAAAGTFQTFGTSYLVYVQERIRRVRNAFGMLGTISTRCEFINY